MIAYNKTFLENTFLVSEATNLKESGFIQEADLSKIKVDFEALKTNKNVFVRFGFFLLGSFLFSSIIGFISLLFSNSFDSVYKVIGFIFFLAGFLVLELLCKEKIFRHGLDDAFIIGTQMCFYISVYVVTESQIAIAISMIVVGLIYTLRYVSSLSFVVFLSGIVYLISVLLINYSTISSVLPFVLLVLAGIFYSIYQKIKNNEQLYFYKNVLDWFFVFSLFLGYASINYFVVRTLSEELLNADYSKSDVPFGWIFNLLMFLLPIGYTIYALKTKNRTMLYVGALTFVLSVATFRYFHSIMPAEWAIIISGLLIFGAVYFVIQKIKDKPTGITFQPDQRNSNEMLKTVEVLIVNSQDMHHAQATQESDMPFGGGGFSGGGAGESF